jgi:hypothetical protein
MKREWYCIWIVRAACFVYVQTSVTRVADFVTEP